MRLISFILLFLILSLKLLATNMYVGNAADITKALKTIKPGDTLIMKNGYWSNQIITFKAQGTAAAPIVLKAETPGLVILNNSSSLSINGSYTIVDGLYFKDGPFSGAFVISIKGSHQRLTNTAIVNYNFTGVKAADKWITLEGSDNRIDHCSFQDKKTDGILITLPVAQDNLYHVIDSNYFGYRENDGEVIRLGCCATNAYFKDYITVRDNYFEDVSGNDAEIISSKCSNNFFMHNSFVRCKGLLSLRVGDSSLVEKNFFFGENVDSTGGVKVYGTGHRIKNNYFQDLKGRTGFIDEIQNEMALGGIVIMNGSPSNPNFPVVKGVIIYSNLMVHNREFITSGYRFDDTTKNLPPQDVLFRGNIFCWGDSALIKLFSVPENMQWETNILYGTDKGMQIDSGLTTIYPVLAPNKFNIWLTTTCSPQAIKALDANPNLIFSDHSIIYPIQKNETGVRWTIDQTAATSIPVAANRR